MTQLDWRELWPSETVLQTPFPKSYLNNLFSKMQFEWFIKKQ